MITIALVTICSAAVMGILVWYFAPTNTNITENYTFSQRDYKPNNLPTLQDFSINRKVHDKSSFRKEKKLKNILHSWEDNVETPTSAVISVATTSSKSEPTQETQKVSTGLSNILERMNKSWRDSLLVSETTNTISDQDVYDLAYYNSTVELGTNKQGTSSSASELHKYGNELAEKLTTFRIVQGDQLSLLDAFIKNSSNPSTQNKVNSLAAEYENLAEDLNTLNTPQSVQSINSALSNSLSKMSSQLEILAEKKTGSDIYKHTLAYNKTSAELAKNTLRLIDAFIFAGVKFESHEPGSIFMFK